ncbi:MAG TPA: carboxypeptidase regulatory-like domain-containing protein [Gemmatimonadaceae bacterium]
MRRTLTFILTSAALLTSALSATSRAQTPTLLLVRVRDSTSGAPLPNAEVTALGRSALTNGRGQVRIEWPAEGVLTVRVRQLGFRYVQRTVQRGTSPTATEDTLTIALQRAAFALPQVTTVAQPRCRDEDANAPPTPLSASAMELLRFGAEQYGTFRGRYPFALTVVRRTELFEPYRNASKRDSTEELTNSKEWGDRYFPGRVLQQTGRNSWFVPLLFVSALADSAFWARHCFVARGVEDHDGRRVIRLDFSPARDVNEAEWEGAAWIDSAASVLARVEFRLTNMREYGGPRRFEGYTVFTTPSPYIARPDSTVARWWSNGSAMMKGGWSQQALVIRDVRYTKEEPPR